MTIRTFWTLFIKMVGIWLILNSLTFIPQFFSALLYVNSTGSVTEFAPTAILLIVVIVLYILLLRLLLFKSAWLIDKLHLDKGFDESKIDLTVQPSSVLTFAVIVTGGFLFVDSLPDLCKEVFLFFQLKSKFPEHQSAAVLITYSVKTVLGYLLMIYSKQVVVFLNRQIIKPNDKKE